MKKPTVIITDPAKVRDICLSQPKATAEQMRRSILIQNRGLSAMRKHGITQQDIAETNPPRIGWEI